MGESEPILVTGAGGGVAGIGRTVAEALTERGLPVRAMVHHDDERADALRGLGIEVIVGDLTRPPDVARALDGVRRMYFAMSVSPSYLEAAATVATVARSVGALEALVDISQMTVSQMNALSAEESRQQRLHWLSAQLLDWSTLPVVHIRPTIFLDNPLFTVLAAHSIADRSTIELPFGRGRTSPIAAGDVARVVTTVLEDPVPHIGQVYELTGPRSQEMTGIAGEFSRALGRPITYVDVSPEEWAGRVLGQAGLDPHLQQHLVTMARLHRQNRYDRFTRTVERLTGRPAEPVEDFVARHARLFNR
jgi:uncharacterized protein YbjT (DUF2867 family)